MPCAIWNTTAIKWKDANWRWSECGPISPVPIVSINSDGVDATTLIQPWKEEEQWNPYRAGEIKKKMIELICEFEGKKYNIKKELKRATVKVNETKLLTKKLPSIDLKVM